MGLISLNKAVHQVSLKETSFAQQINTEYADLFQEEIGKLPETYCMKLDKEAQPVVRPARRIPAAMQNKVKAELERMVAMGVLSPVSEPTDWVSSMVATHKKNSDEIRLCIDPRDQNKFLKRPHHPMRTVEEVAAQMPNSTVFSVLDAKSSFWQISLDHKSSLLTTFSTPFGRFRFLRMPFGINSASEVFQHAMEQIFAGYPCAVIVDDIIVGGNGKEEHDANLRRVLDRAREVNLRLNPQKCKFRLSEVNYVGHIFTSKGLRPDPEKAKAITEMQPPDNVTALQRFLGMINYLGKFIPNLSELSAPLRELTCKNTEWCWFKHHQDAFDNLKHKISSPPTLKYYDVQKSVTLTCDASQFGLGAACLQEGAPVAYTSRTLTQTEVHYAQIEKELLAVVFACTKFNDYIYGKQIHIETDHQPLVTILNKPIYTAPARLQRMMLRLQKYNFTITYKKGKQMYLADTLSHSPRADPNKLYDDSADFEVMSVRHISSSRLNELQTHTAQDPVLQRLCNILKSGWPSSQSKLPVEIRKYFPFRDELTVDEDIIMKGQKVVVPESLRSEYVTIIHRGHPGLEATKRRARGIVFWPSLNKDIENQVLSCSICNSLKSHQQKEPLHLHYIPDLPWSTVAMDIFEWNGQHYLALVDSYSGWFEIDLLRDLSSSTVITKLKRHFSVHGSPHKVLSDNGTQFTSQRFKEFAAAWDFTHITSSPEYPQANGLAERAVQSAKQLMEKSKRDGSDVFQNLLNIRNIPRDQTLGSPAERLMSRQTRTTLPISKSALVPASKNNISVKEQLSKKRQCQKTYYDKSSKALRPLLQGEVVRLATSKGHDRIGLVKKLCDEPRSYLVQSEGKEYRRNRKHILPVSEPPPQQFEQSEMSLPLVQTPSAESKHKHPTPDEVGEHCTSQETKKKTFTEHSTKALSKTPYVTRAGRLCKPNPKYMD
ncbi:Transposon Ty3-G Gag-Pol poly [Labeo rohita]|uniref:Gypsy retrotransposon integrase-like protein 1 n=1 Tax=Labeo rohita TaxID=84645 RepID=A0A498MQ89_LABRO|nr:Transposon Ty3-G Gag-Pol poly [Labeo rohita]